MVNKLLTIAGSDSSGGAGIQADLKTFSALGAYGASVICSVTAQNTVGVTDVFDVSCENVKAQLDAVFSDLDISAVKIGMVSASGIICEIAKALKKYKPKHIVLDPVMVSTSGHRLCEESAAADIVEKLVPLATLVTPNIPEAEIISGITVKNTEDMVHALEIIHQKGAKNVLIKGGHLEGDAVDTLLCGGKIYTFTAERVDTVNTHGTGCTLSSAITAYLAEGDSVDRAVGKAKEYLTNALRYSYGVGKGHGPVNHFWNIKK